MARRRGRSKRRNAASPAAQYLRELATEAGHHRGTRKSWTGKLGRLRRLIRQEQTPEVVEGGVEGQAVLFAAEALEQVRGAFEALETWPVRGTVQIEAVWQNNGSIIEEPVIRVPLPLVGETFSQGVMNAARAWITEAKSRHPELGSESPQLGVRRLLIDAGAL